MLRFVHSADLHLDSPLRSLGLRNAELAGLVGGATRQVVARMVDLCLDERVDALLLAGDLYDGEQTSIKTALFLAEQLRRLDQAGIRTLIVRGNHDAQSRITAELTLPPSVTVFDAQTRWVDLDRGPGARPVRVHGLSFAHRKAPENPLSRFAPPLAGAVNIGLLHTSLGGAAGHDDYAPCSLADLFAQGFDYWALGHVHRRQEVWQGGQVVVMPGQPQGRDIGEAGAKSVSVVAIDDAGAISVEERVLALAQFERVDVDLDAIADWPAMVAAMAAALRAARQAVSADHLIARLSLRGQTPLAWRLGRDGDLALAEARNQASAIGATWVEKLSLDCRPVDYRPGVGGGEGAGALSDLRALIAAEVVGSPGFAAELAGVAEDMLRKLPPELRDILGGDDAEGAGLRGQLAEEGVLRVLAGLRGGAGDDAP